MFLAVSLHSHWRGDAAPGLLTASEGRNRARTSDFVQIALDIWTTPAGAH